MKRYHLLISLVLAALFVIGPGCGVLQGATGKLKVVTTLFPQYDFVQEIGKDKVAATLLLPPGVEPHSFEPSPQDIVGIRKADVFVYTGEYMEPWAHKVIEGVKGKKIVIVDTSRGIELMKEEEEHEDHDEHEGEEEHHHHGGKDPHIWLDPVLARQMVSNIVAGLAKADPQHAAFYKQNGAAYQKRLQKLDREFAAAFAKARTKTIIYGGHFAFGYFAKRYGLKYISPYSGFAPDAEPTPQRIAELIKTIKKTGTKVIYYEELIDPKVAKVIADQTGAKMLLLHGLHNISKAELKAKVSYVTLMEGNLERLKQGLGYGG
ncbi:zinc transport system substrate-binding protein [Hydrogenispora ethanolica]|uniref:Zinc transport system substrate-binding protein n=1 Tax=Hydrogenispora ethanolica TaxID=1082276 RepID=A0A4R1RQF7_HYDET|nr:metal ABC transporter substrate-binding protein [Hydrogenispora ethanolica]TCL68536.1 zinc transport system substrate-binding protein [Hydrogenispora ethanolica]